MVHVMNLNEKFILVGQIISAHGIRGAVKIQSFTDPIENILNYKLFFKEENEIELIYSFSKGKMLICNINNINDRNQAEQISKRKIYTKRKYLPKIEINEFYIADLINLPVLNNENKKIGTVTNIFNFGAGDLVELTYVNKETKIIKFNEDNFPEITEQNIITTIENNEK